MKHGPSLEEERRALLEHIHASRASYRRMLMEIDEEQEARVHHRAEQMAGGDPAFPRSMTMRWLVAHPYASLAAVALVAAGTPLAVRAAAKWRREQQREQDSLRFMAAAAPVPQPGGAASHPYYAQPVYGKPSSPRPAVAAIRAAATSLTAIAAMVLRDPAKMRMAMRLASNAATWARQRRAAQHP